MRILGTLFLLLFIVSPAYAQVTNPPGGNGGGGTYCHGIFIENIRELINVDLDRSTIIDFDVRFGGEFPMSREIKIEAFDEDDTIEVLAWAFFPLSYTWGDKLNTGEVLPRDEYGVCKATTYLTGVAGGDSYSISQSESEPRQEANALWSFHRLPSIDPTTGQYLAAPAGKDFLWGRLFYDTFFDSALDNADQINVYLVNPSNTVKVYLFGRGVSNTSRGVVSDSEPQMFLKADFVNGAGTHVTARAELLNNQSEVIDSATFLIKL